MKGVMFLKSAAVLGLTSLALAGTGNAGERDIGLLGPGVAVGSNHNVAVMKGYQAVPTVPQTYQLQIPTTRLRAKCQRYFYWNGIDCVSRYGTARPGK